MIERTTVLVCSVCILLAGVCFAADQQIPKAQVIAEKQNKLYRAHVSKHGDVQVGLDDGVATLSGKVDSLGVKQDAEEAAGKADEVTSVVNQFTAVMDQSTPQQILEPARKQIVLYPFYMIFDGVVLEANGGAPAVYRQATDLFGLFQIG